MPPHTLYIIHYEFFDKVIISPRCSFTIRISWRYFCHLEIKMTSPPISASFSSPCCFIPLRESPSCFRSQPIKQPAFLSISPFLSSSPPLPVKGISQSEHSKHILNRHQPLAGAKSRCSNVVLPPGAQDNWRDGICNINLIHGCGDWVTLHKPQRAAAGPRRQHPMANVRHTSNA